MSGQKAGTRRERSAASGRWPDFGGGGPFPSRSSKKISFAGSWLHFLEASHSLCRDSPAGFRRGAHVPPATWSSSSAARICGDSGPRTCEQSAQGLVAVGKAVIGNQVLPDGHGIPAASESLLDQLAVRLAGTGGPILVASRR